MRTIKKLIQSAKKKDGGFFSFRTQLILIYTVISILVLSVGSYFSYRYITDLLKNNNEKYMLQQFKQADSNIQAVISEVDRLSRLFLLDANVQELLEENYSKVEFEVILSNRSIFNRIDDFIFNYNFIDSFYIYTDSGGGIGGGSRNSIIMRNKEEGCKSFFASGIYDGAIEAFPRNIIIGGYNTIFFNPETKDSGNYIISLARGVKAMNKPVSSAVLVMNVNEKYIASMYSKTTDLNNRIYITDKTGKIISSRDGSDIGKQSALLSHIGEDKAYGSYTAEEGKSSRLVVYYRLEDTGWYLAAEAPLNMFSEDIMAWQRITVFVFTASVLIMFAVSFFLLWRITEPLKMLASKMHDLGKGRLGLTIRKVPGNELGFVIRRFNEMSLNIMELMKKNDEIQEEKRILEINALQAQINPHFLYNTLNMIKWMAAVAKVKNVVDSILALGNILKPAFTSTDTTCTLQEEIEYTENYIKIMNWRFGNGISFSFDIQENIYHLKVPRFILQPLVENSVKHGMDRFDKQIIIIIDIHVKNDELVIAVSDNGCGIEPEKLEEVETMLKTGNGDEGNQDRSIGLYNVNRRICLNYGEQYGIKVNSEHGKGTTVIIRIPCVQ